MKTASPGNCCWRGRRSGMYAVCNDGNRLSAVCYSAVAVLPVPPTAVSSRLYSRGARCREVCVIVVLSLFGFGRGFASFRPMFSGVGRCASTACRDVPLANVGNKFQIANFIPDIFRKMPPKGTFSLSESLTQPQEEGEAGLSATCEPSPNQSSARRRRCRRRSCPR